MEFKKKIVLTVAVMGLGIVSSHAQTGIGTVNPDNSAQLDVSSAKRGLLMPRLALVKTTEQTPVVGTAAKSLMVYNTVTINDVTPGYYYWDSLKWVRVADDTTIPQEPWYDVDTDKGATAMTQKIYHTAGVGIGRKPFSDISLDVNGSIRGGSNTKEITYSSIGVNSIVVGKDLDGQGNGNAIFGTNSFIRGTNNVAGGENNTAKTVNSAVFGSGNTVNYANAFIMGSNNYIGGGGDGSMSDGSAVFGSGNSIKDFALNSNSEGNTVFGLNNLIDGQNNGDVNTNTVFGKNNNLVSSATGVSGATIFGQGNTANKSNQFVIGAYNKNADNALFEIGTGTTALHANAVTVLANGNTGIGTEAPLNTLHVKGTNPLKLEGLQAGATTDKFLTADENGVVRMVDAAGGGAPTEGAGNMTSKNLISVSNGTKNAFKDTEISLTPATVTKYIMQTTGTTTLAPTWVDPALVVLEPWKEAVNDTQATSNTQNIYQMGTVGVGKKAALGVNVDISGSIRAGNNKNSGFTYGYFMGTNSIVVGDNVDVEGDNSAAFGSNFMVRGSNSIAAGINLFLSSNGTAVFGTSNRGDVNNSLVAGINNTIESMQGGGSDGGGNAIIGSNNAITNFHRLDNVFNNIVFGGNNIIDGVSGGVSAHSNAVFGSNNTVHATGSGGVSFDNNTIFGKNNAVNGLMSGTYGATVFGESNIANNNNQFVIGSGNENKGNALFEIGIGSADLRANAVTVLSNGSVGIGTATPDAAYKLYVNGQAGGTMAWSQLSDRRYKKDITPITGALDKIMKIQGVGYNWRTEEFKDKNFDSKHQLGVIAQDIEKILPDAVNKDENGYYSVSYTTLVPVLVEAVKEQQKQIEELKALVKQLADKK